MMKTFENLAMKDVPFRTAFMLSKLEYMFRPKKICVSNLSQQCLTQKSLLRFQLLLSFARFEPRYTRLKIMSVSVYRYICFRR